MKIKFEDLKSILDLFYSIQRDCLEYELEFKFSNFKENDFFILKQYFNHIQPKYVEKNILLYPNNYRSVNGEWEIKEKLNSIDIKHELYDIRLTKSIEKSVKQVPYLEITGKRDKKIWVYEFQHYNIELSIINDHKYECEIEYKIFTLPSNIIFKPLNEIISVISNYNKVSSSFNKCFDFKGTALYFPINKPINLKKNISIVNSHICFAKKDGVRYLLYLSDIGTYLINQTHLIKVDDTTHKQKSILDCEFKDGDFFVFDSLLHKDEPTTDFDFKKRYRLAKTHGYKMMEYKKPTRTMVKKMINCKENDGVVFTPLSGGYKNNNTFKFKPSSRLTIDFLFKNDSLYVYGKSGLIPVDYKFEIPSNLSNKIIECLYVSGVFVPYKLRPDKVCPNYIDVCKDVMKDILDPLDVENIFKQ